MGIDVFGGSHTQSTVFFVAASGAKMVLYIDGYGLTRLRVLTCVIEVFFGITAVMVSIWLFLPKLPYMKAVILAGLLLGALIYGKLKLSGGATEAVKNAKVPIMIIHGEDDRFVPCEMSRKIHAANPKMIRLETFPDAGHGMSYMNDAKRYEKITEEFFKECGL